MKKHKAARNIKVNGSSTTQRISATNAPVTRGEVYAALVTAFADMLEVAKEVGIGYAVVLDADIDGQGHATVLLHTADKASDVMLAVSDVLIDMDERGELAYEVG